MPAVPPTRTGWDHHQLGELGVERAGPGGQVVTDLVDYVTGILVGNREGDETLDE